MKRLLSLIVILFVVAIPLISLSAEAGSSGSITEEGFATKIAYLQTVFRDGEYWNGYNACGYEGTGTEKCYCSSYCAGTCSCSCGQFYYNNTWIGGQCHGFALKMGNLIFGGNPNSWAMHYNSSLIYAGDVVRISNDTHTIFITKVTDTTIYYADCNSTGPCQVKWNRSMTKTVFASKFTYCKHLSGNTLTGTGSISAYTVSYNLNGGIMTSTVKNSFTATGMNTGRGTNQLIIFTRAYGATTGTNQYGKEAIIDSTGRITSIPAYGTCNNAIPDGGFVLSGHGNGIVNINTLSVNDYVSYDANTLAIKVFPDKQSYLIAAKKVYNGKAYGDLPTPVKNGFVFNGWYNPSGNKVVSTTVFTGSGNITLTAQWIELTWQKNNYAVINENDTITLQGTVSSSVTINWVGCTIFDLDFNVLCAAENYPNSKSFDLSQLNNQLITKTATLADGEYYYEIFATVTGGNYYVGGGYFRIGEEPVLNAITIKTVPLKTSYSLGDTLETVGISLTGTYSDGSTQTVTSDFTCSPMVLSAVGTQHITVTYNGKTTTFSVTVTDILRLRNESICQIDPVNKLLIGVEGGQDVAYIKGQCLQNNVLLYKNDTILTDTAPVGTGSVVKLMDGSNVLDEITLVVSGDVNGDSVVDALDMFLADSSINSHLTLTGAYFYAANLDDTDELLNISDYSVMMNLALKKS